MYVTGGIGPRWDNEAFGADYELPARAYAETCASIGSIMWNARMLTLDARRQVRRPDRARPSTMASCPASRFRERSTSTRTRWPMTAGTAARHGSAAPAARRMSPACWPSFPAIFYSRGCGRRLRQPVCREPGRPDLPDGQSVTSDPDHELSLGRPHPDHGRDGRTLHA